MDRIITETIIGAAIEVHRHWGPGLLERIYEESLIHELKCRGVELATQVPLHLTYKDLHLRHDFRMDLIVQNKVIVEIKSVSELDPIHEAQLLTYLKLSGLRIGLLINFNSLKLKDGIKRLVL
ncbi:MAG TPA: GxxExxY protein [Kiritimatiellia bacterium]|nr:GxxExxY protein [Kiritimatiellia bacterium]HMP35734.1 GxxExxY protein [Kiritimatiellia bacterium]